MAKRKFRKAAQHSPQSLTFSDSDNDPEPSSKMFRRNQPSTSFCSTPREEFSSSFHKPTSMLSSSEDESVKSSYSAINDSNYGDFSSFLKSISLASDSEDEAEMQFSLRPKSTSPSHSANRFSRKCVLQKKRAYELSQSLLEMSSLGTKIIVVPSKNLEIVSLHHPASLTLHGYLKVSVLIGRVSILGYILEEGKETRVFSTEHATLLKASTLKSTYLFSGSLQKKLKRLIQKDQDDELDNFLEQVGPGTVVIVLQKLVPSPSLQFLENYFPNAVKINKGKKIKPSDENERLCSNQENNTYDISSDYETLSEEIKETFLSVSETDFGPRAIVYGSKNTGKSSLLRYLINKALNDFPEVYYLDIDPGQTEFTPAGVVSLVKVTEPLLGPPYSHGRKPVRMVFTGAVSAESSPPMYIKSVLNLIEVCNLKFPHVMLLVNTMGWIQGVGEFCLQSVLEALNPKILIKFIDPDEISEMKKENLSSGIISYQIPAVRPGSIYFAPKDLRDFALMTYFGKCQKVYREPLYLQAIRPVIVSWDKLAVYVMGRNVPPSRLIEAIHCSIVGLCRVNRSFMLESDTSEFPKTLLNEPVNECLGLGFVRATDETKHLLYIITPLTVEELKPVNAIIKGNIQLPGVVYLKQDIPNLPLPYTDCSKEAPTPTRKRVRRKERTTLRT